MKSIKKIKKGILLLMALCMVLYGCRKNEIGNVNLKTDHLLEKVFKNSANVKPEFLPDVSAIRDGLSKNEALLKKITGEVLWNQMANARNGQFALVPVNKENEKSIQGFILLNKKDPNNKITEYYPFALSVDRSKKTLNVRESFLTNLYFNKKINGVIKYEFNSFSQTPYLFRKLMKADDYKAIPTDSKITITISNKSESSGNASEETGMAISSGGCSNWICTIVELPNFIFVPVCWCEEPSDPNGGEPDNSWWPEDWYVDPYGTQNSGGGGGSGPSSLDAMYDYVISTLFLDPSAPATYENLYLTHPQNFVQVYFYLQNSTSLAKIETATEHLEKLNTANPTIYSNFVYNQQATSANPNLVWWEDTNWLNTGASDLQQAQLLSVDRSGVTDPRLVALLQKIQNTTIKSKILKTYFATPQQSPFPPHKFKVKFVEVNTLVGASGQQVPAQSSVTHLPNNEHEVEVKLNISMFNGKTQEWVATVILHELLHGILPIFDSSIITNLDAHNYMFTKGLPKMIATALGTIFPGIDPHNALALGLDGMAEVLTKPNPNNPDQFFYEVFTNTMYYQTIAQVIHVINQYLTGALGTPF
jgi:hypothetical protein